MTDAAGWLRELSHLWPLLRGSTPTEVATAPLSVAFAGTDVRLAVDGIGRRHLLVPVVGEEKPEVKDAEGALSARLQDYAFAHRPHRYLDVVCGRPDLFDLFDEVLVDVLRTLTDASDPPAVTTIRVIDRWRTLLQTHTRRLLSLTAQMALVGELLVLEIVAPEGPLDLSCWRGPLREAHDILLADRALEVKALGPTSTNVEIHGVDQLEPPDLPLALVLATVIEDVDGFTLPELVERILGRAADRGVAIRRLAAVGYVRLDADRYAQRFTMSEIAHVEIDDAVPRIVPASFAGGVLPVGIDDLTYTIGLRMLEPLTSKGETALRAWAGRQR